SPLACYSLLCLLSLKPACCSRALAISALCASKSFRFRRLRALFRPTNNLWLSITSAFFSYAFALFAQNIRCGGGITFSFRKFLGKPRRPDLIKVSHSLGSQDKGQTWPATLFTFFYRFVREFVPWSSPPARLSIES